MWEVVVLSQGGCAQLRYAVSDVAQHLGSGCLGLGTVPWSIHLISNMHEVKLNQMERKSLPSIGPQPVGVLQRRGAISTKLDAYHFNTWDFIRKVVQHPHFEHFLFATCHG